MKLLRRNLSLMLAMRYLNPLRTFFSIITLICLLGVALGVMVLIVVLSVMEGLQAEMETRTLAFTPHFEVCLYEGPQRIALSEPKTHWNELLQKIQTIRDVTCVYPQVEGDAFVSGDSSRSMARFSALQPGNKAQLEPLLPMLKQGVFDFGAGLDQECVISLRLAQTLGLNVGDKLHLIPIGSQDEIAAVYSLIQHPLQTHEDRELMQGLASLFEGSTRTEKGNDIVSPEKLTALVDRMNRLLVENKLRRSEREALQEFCDDASDHMSRQPFSAAEKARWLARTEELAKLDRDREDGKSVKEINRMVMPMDLAVVGIYQPPENMPGPGVYLPLPIAQEVCGYNQSRDDEVMGLCVRVTNPHECDKALQHIHDVLTDSGATDAPGEMGNSWLVEPWTRSFEQWYKLIANERIMMSFVLSIISLIASFCIMAVMFTVSLQRRREIAVLQALGATPTKIMAIFTWQGIIIGLAGALLGVLLALIVLHFRLEIQAVLASVNLDPFPMEAHGITLPAAYTPSTFFWQAFRAFIMVIIAATIPALFISRQDPAKALRSN